MSDRYVVIDVETSCLFDFSKPADAEGQPRLAHMALIYLDSEFNVERDYDVLIRPDGWTAFSSASPRTCRRSAGLTVAGRS